MENLLFLGVPILKHIRVVWTTHCGFTVVGVSVNHILWDLVWIVLVRISLWSGSYEILLNAIALRKASSWYDWDTVEKDVK